MFIWAYALLRVRTFYKSSHIEVNFHLGLLFVMSSGILYPLRVENPVAPYKLLIAFFATGIMLGFSQLLFVAGLGLNKKTGSLIILTCISVIVGYALSFFRYG
jgi:hypothetical protein